MPKEILALIILFGCIGFAHFACVKWKFYDLPPLSRLSKFLQFFFLATLVVALVNTFMAGTFTQVDINSNDPQEQKKDP